MDKDFVVIISYDKDDFYYKKMAKDDRHLLYIKEYVKFNNLNYDFKDNDDNVAPLELVSDNYFVVKSSCDFMKMAIFYVPLMVNKKMYEFVLQNKESLKLYDYLGFYFFNSINDFYKCEGLEEGLKVLEKRYYESIKIDNEDKLFK